MLIENVIQGICSVHLSTAGDLFKTQGTFNHLTSGLPKKDGAASGNVVSIIS